MSQTHSEQSAHGEHGHDAHGHDAHGHGEHVYPYTPHHFHEAKQHFDSGKMGVWLFLVTEILFFAGLFCAYTIYRSQHPEVFYWAHFFLDTKMGAANTVVLILSSLTAAWAVRNAQLGQTGFLRLNILLTIGGALFFMCVKYVEYSHKFHDGLLPGRHFAPTHEVWETEAFKHKHPESAKAAERISAELTARQSKTAIRDTVVPSPLATPDMKLVPVANPGAEGEPAVGETSAVKAPIAPNVDVPPPVQRRDVAQAEAEQGAAAANAVASTAGAPSSAAAPAAGKALTAAAASPAAATPAAAGKGAAELPTDIWLESEIRKLTHEERHPLEMAGVIRKGFEGGVKFARPENAGVFFSIYFFMTGLHGVHVVIGIGIWVWMLTIAARRKFGPKYFGPIDFSALYWHLVDLIWIYLFPLLYLIH